MNRRLALLVTCVCVAFACQSAQARGRGTCPNCQIYYPAVPVAVAPAADAAPAAASSSDVAAPEQPAVNVPASAPAVASYSAVTNNRIYTRARWLRRWRR